MMKKIFLLLFLLLIGSKTFSQNYNWSFGLGNYDDDEVRTMVIGPNNEIYIAGDFSNIVDFDPSSSVFNLVPNYLSPIYPFVAKYDLNKNFIWAFTMEGQNLSSSGQCESIFYDQGNIYVTGNFQGQIDCDPSSSSFIISAPSHGIFIAKYSSAGNFIWAESINTTGSVACIKGDHQGNIIIGGVFSGTVDFDPSIATFNLIAQASSNDAFVAKYNSSGNFIWAKQVTGPSSESCSRIGIDVNDNIYFAGSFASTADFDPSIGIFNLTSSGLVDTYIEKISPVGIFKWAIKFGNASNNNPSNFCLDPSNGLYITGYFWDSIDFDPGIGVRNLTALGYSDAYVAKYDTLGNLSWCFNLGGTNGDVVSSGFDSDGSKFYVSGTYRDTIDFDPGIGTAILPPRTFAPSATFVACYDTAGSFNWAFGTDTCGWGNGYLLTPETHYDNMGDVYIAGKYTDTVDMKPGIGASLLYPASTVVSFDLFAAKYSAITVSVSPSASQLSKLDLITYPNPCSDILKIKLNDGSNSNESLIGEVYSVTGKLLNSFVFNGSDEELNISGYAVGIYYVSIKSKFGVYTKKFVVN